MRFKASLLALTLSLGLGASARTFISGVVDFANSFTAADAGSTLSRDVTLLDQSNHRYILLVKPTTAKDFRIYITDTDFNIIKVFRIDQFYLNSKLSVYNFFLYPATSQENDKDLLMLDTSLGVISMDLDTLKAKHHILQSGFYDVNFGNLETLPRVEINKASVIRLPGT